MNTITNNVEAIRNVVMGSFFFGRIGSGSSGEVSPGVIDDLEVLESQIGS